MKTAGIISEYNPFHNGHKYHIEKTREQGIEAVVCVMSSYFVQRGETAIMLPEKRARAALKNGADLVISLPCPWACAGAQVFARGAVSLINNTGCIDALSFGSECADIEKLKTASELIDSLATEENIKKYLSSGLSFASARQRAIEEIDSDIAKIISNPNDTLAVEYLRAMRLSNSDMIPIAVKREGAGHDSTDFQNNIASASLIRKILRDNALCDSLMPENCAEILKEEISFGRAPSDIKKIESAILAFMRCACPELILNTPDISEGLENRIYSASRQSKSLEELYELAKTKRYSHARIRRAVINTFLGITQEDVKDDPPYIKVLGFTQNGQKILKQMKKSAKIPILMRSADCRNLDDRGKHILALESKCADLFSLTLPQVQPCGIEYTSQIAIEK